MKPTEIRAVLASRGLRPLKQFGQHFLHDENLIQWWGETIAGSVHPGETVLEVGPGLGALTGELIRRGISVLAIEKDRGLAEYLREQFTAGLTLIEGDALDFIPPPETSVRILVGNLPYNITTPLLVRWASLPEPPEEGFFLVQREMALRMVASVGSEDYGSLAVTLQSRYSMEILRAAPGSIFYPPPEVESSFLRWKKKENGLVSAKEFPEFEAWVRKGFSQRRKKLKNLLPVADERRAEELSLDEWVAAFLGGRSQ